MIVPNTLTYIQLTRDGFYIRPLLQSIKICISKNAEFTPKY